MRSGNVFIDALTTPSWLDVAGTNQISYYFASDFGRAWTDAEKAAFRSALSGYADVAAISFIETLDPASANLYQNLVNSQQMQDTVGAGYYASIADMIAATGTSDWAAWQYLPNVDGAKGYFNHLWDGWGAFSPGSKACWLLTHEIGHGLGLAHPFDTLYGNSNTFPGVNSVGDPGDFGLNSTLTTEMSYSLLSSPSTTYGQANGPMAFDIAALQHMYGANTTFAQSNDVYVLPDQDVAGTHWSCIWDTGGTDYIVYNGSRATTIDLRAATLLDAPGGGGYISQAAGVHGGVTIANGVVIENARGGSGPDHITGNSANNFLSGGRGDDKLFGLGGNDNLSGGAGSDSLSGGDGNDVLYGGSGRDFLWGGPGDDTFVYKNIGESLPDPRYRDCIRDFTPGQDKIDLHEIDANSTLSGNQAFHFIGTQPFHGTAGELHYTHLANGRTLIEADTTGGGTATFQVELMSFLTLTKSDFIL